MEHLAKGDVVQFAGPARSGGYWPKKEELGLVEDAYDEVVVVVWELAGGPAAWPVAWIVKIPTAEPDSKGAARVCSAGKSGQ